jgi:acyl-coenzyme A thioesterase PaaI-like protein
VENERDRAAAAARELVRRLSGPSVPAGVADALEALVAMLPPAGSRFTPREREAFAAGRGDIDARGTHPARGMASPSSAAVARIDGGLSVTFDVRHEGPPGVAHGSFVAGFFDVALGLVAIDEAGLGLTTRLDVRFRRPTPLGVPVAYTGGIVESDGRTTVVDGRAVAGDTEVATARLTFRHP